MKHQGFEVRNGKLRILGNRLCRCGETLCKDTSGDSRFAGEANIAARHRQAVVFSNNWTSFNLNSRPEICSDLAEDGELLEILLAVVGVSGTDCLVQHGDDGRHAVEVTWARGSFKQGAKSTDRHGHLRVIRPSWIELGHFWSHDHGRSASFGESTVSFERAGIASKIVRVPELKRVDED